jgi:plastocyanin
MEYLRGGPSLDMAGDYAGLTRSSTMNTARFAVGVLTVSTLIALHVSCSAPPKSAATAPAAQATQPAPVVGDAAGVRIDNFHFLPQELKIPAGTTVTWQNADDVPHTVTSRDGDPILDSGALDTDDKFSFTFKQPGTYSYYCKVHPHMTGVVIVK